MFMVLLSWHGHCKRLPSSFDECKVELSAMWPLANLGYHSASVLLPFTSTFAIFYYLFVGQQEEHLACKKLSGGVLAWLSV